MSEIRGRIRESVDGLKERPLAEMRSDAETRRQEHLREMAEQRKQEKEKDNK